MRSKQSIKVHQSTIMTNNEFLTNQSHNWAVRFFIIRSNQVLSACTLSLRPHTSCCSTAHECCGRSIMMVDAYFLPPTVQELQVLVLHYQSQSTKNCHSRSESQAGIITYRLGTTKSALGDLLTSGSKELSQSGGEKLQYLQTIFRFEKRGKDWSWLKQSTNNQKLLLYRSYKM